MTVGGVLAVAVGASGDGRPDHVLIAMLALLALASFEAVTQLVSAARELSSTLAAGRRILQLTNDEPVVRDPKEPAPAPSWPFAMAREGACATYPHQPHPALDAVGVRLGPGERAALVGRRGAGKTTVVDPLLHSLDPEAGRVTLAVRDARAYRHQDIRRVIAVAGLESHAFTASIRDSLRLARPGASDSEIEQAPQQARVWDWTSGLPGGLDTLAGQQGRELSGGQRQRIVLARALLVAAPVLVLDEPTTHLDSHTASDLIADVFSAAREQRLITHRTEGLELVDRVISLVPPPTPDFRFVS